MESPGIKKTKVVRIKEHLLFGLKAAFWYGLLDLALKIVPIFIRH
jgi:hypothetical protein